MFYGDVTELHPKELPNIKITRTINVNYPNLPDCKISIKKSLQTRWCWLCKKMNKNRFWFCSLQNCFKFMEWSFSLFYIQISTTYSLLYNTLPKSNMRRQFEFYKKVKDQLQKQLSTEKKIDIDGIEDQG